MALVSAVLTRFATLGIFSWTARLSGFYQLSHPQHLSPVTGHWFCLFLTPHVATPSNHRPKFGLLALISRFLASDPSFASAARLAWWKGSMENWKYIGPMKLEWLDFWTNVYIIFITAISRFVGHRLEWWGNFKQDNLSTYRHSDQPKKLASIKAFFLACVAGSARPELCIKFMLPQYPFIWTIFTLPIS